MYGGEPSNQLPEAFKLQMKAMLREAFPAFQKALASPPPTSIRVNPSKSYQLNPKLEQVPWCNNGYYLPDRPVFTLDPAFHAGAYYVQEASSMFIHHIVRSLFDQQEPLLALDLCAAPGGKSTLLIDALPGESLLVANEVIKNRYRILRENLIKWGSIDVITTRGDGENFAPLEGLFDLVVVDAPCSGEGLFRKNPRAKEEWSSASIRLCSARQKRILHHAAKLVKNDGLLIYSTCTYNDLENRENAVWLSKEMAFEKVRLSVPEDWGIAESDLGYQFFPHRLKGEGFFTAVFRKKTGKSKKKYKVKGFKNLVRLSGKSCDHLFDWIEKAAPVAFYQTADNKVIGMKAEHVKTVQILANTLDVVHAGVVLGDLKRKGLFPSHALALSQWLRKDFPVVQLEKNEALKYLKKEELKWNDMLQGWYVVQYQGNPLGWVKGLKNRVNNYYPKEWRIKMSLE